MSIGEADLKSRFTLPRGVVDSVAPLAKNQEAIERELELMFLMDDALTAGSDWLEASGGTPLTKEGYSDLYLEGFVSFGAEKVEQECGDWASYQQQTVKFYEQRKFEKQARESALLDAAKQGVKHGLIPDVLLRQVVTYTEETSSGRKRKRFRFTDDSASDDEILSRYAKYLVADSTLKDRPGEPAKDERKASIALGFTISSESDGISLSSFVGSLQNSHTHLKQADIEQSAEDLGVYDYVFPDSRKNHLGAMLASVKPAPEYYYDLKNQKILVLGRIAVSEFRKFEGQAQIERLANAGRLLVGGNALRVYTYAERRGTLYGLGELLRSDDVILPNLGKRAINAEVSKDDVLGYLGWLTLVCVKDSEQGGNKNLNEKIIKRAFRLGLGPSYQQVARRTFSSLTEAYQELNQQNLHLVGQFDEWPREKFLEYLRLAGTIKDRTPNLADLIELARQDRRKPSPFRIIKEFGSLTAAYAEAGFIQYANGKRFIKHPAKRVALAANQNSV